MTDPLYLKTPTLVVCLKIEGQSSRDYIGLNVLKSLLFDELERVVLGGVESAAQCFIAEQIQLTCCLRERDPLFFYANIIFSSISCSSFTLSIP